MNHTIIINGMAYTMFGPMIAWWNFRTGKYDYHSELPSDMSDYVPQSRVDDFNLYRLVGEMVEEEAAARVLGESVGRKETICDEN